MKAGIHPEMKETNVICACGATFKTKSTAKEDINIEICDKCHPFYTGEQGKVKKAGNVDKFNSKYGFNDKK